MNESKNSLQPFRLDNKVALITGAASGIGLATAQLFSDVGARVVIADIDNDAAVDAAKLIGPTAIGVRCDVADEESVAGAFDAAESAFGTVTVMINNAAGRSKANFLDMSVKEWDQVHHICTRGTFLCSREAIRRMLSKDLRGSIVNISTAASLHPMIFANAHYDSAKAGVNALTRDCAIEFAANNIRVNAIAPGGTDTPGSRKIVNNEAVKISGPALTEGRQPMKRRGTPEELAQAILFMASDASSYVTGQILAVDGGYTVS